LIRSGALKALKKTQAGNMCIKKGGNRRNQESSDDEDYD